MKKNIDLETKLENYTFDIPDNYRDKILESDIAAYAPGMAQMIIRNIDEFNATAARLGRPMNALSLLGFFGALVNEMLKARSPKTMVFSFFEFIPTVVLGATIPDKDMCNDATDWWYSVHEKLRHILTH